jgi:hypothetical protein
MNELTSFTPGEPDPALFQPPQGYEIVTEPLHQVQCGRNGSQSLFQVTLNAS